MTQTGPEGARPRGPARAKGRPRPAPPAAGDAALERRRLEALYDVTRRLTAVHETSAVLSLIVSEAARLLGADAAGLRLIEGAELVLRAQTDRAAAGRMRPRLQLGESLTGLVAATGEPVAVEDLHEDTRFDPAHKQAVMELGFHGFVGLPLRAHDRIIGVVTVYTRSRRRFQPDEIALLSVFADQASLAIEKDRLLRETREHATRLRRLVRLNQVVFSALDTGEVLNALAGAAAELMDAAFVSIWSANERAQTLELRAVSDAAFAADYPARMRRFGEGGVGWVAVHRRPLEVPDLLAEAQVAARDWYRVHDLRSALAAPIVFGDALLGVVALFGGRPFQPGADDQELLEGFVGQAALALRNAGLYEELREAHERLARRTRDLDLLARLSEMLQACVTEQEAYDVVGRFLGQGFPGDAGAVFVTSPSRNLVEARTTWGGFPAAEYGVFRPEDCWALRRGRVHAVGGDGGDALRCEHLPAPAPAAALCLPLVAQGESLGLLYLSCPGEGPGGWLQAREALALAIADQLGLATANLKLRDTLRNQSIRDALTGMFNRRYMEETLERELRRAERSQAPLAVIMLDLDHFKHFNDTFGHEAGDALLREFGHLLRTSVRQGDVACRQGGEEFVLVLPEAPAAVAAARAEQIRADAKRLHVTVRGQTIGSVTVSLGVAGFPRHGTTAEELLQAADAALYRAKHAGRDQVVLA